MNYKVLITLCLWCGVVSAQIKTSDLYGSWVSSKVSYLSGDELPDENILKTTYVKHTFQAPNKIFTSGIYYDLGRENVFDVSGDRINIRSAEGSIMNTMRVLEVNQDRLVIVQASMHGLTDPSAIKYTFVKETTLQNNLPFTQTDLFRVLGRDTLYNSGQKIYAQFIGPSFEEYISYNLYKKGISTRTGELLASFIVNANGIADSLKILQGINPKYDKVYSEIFNSARKKWRAATLNGKAVPVLMRQRMKYFTSDEAIPSYFDGQKANRAYNQENYELALFYYDRALESRPEEVEYLYKRGICKQKLGNLEGACTDWRMVKALGAQEADQLLSKFCQNKTLN